MSGAAVPLRPVRLGSRDIAVEHRPDGTIHLRSPHALGAFPRKLTERLEYWAARAPDRILFAQREGNGAWRSISYAQTLAQIRRIGQALIRRNLSADRPIAVLSGNDIEHALLGLAANYVGIPYAPISPAYSLISSDFGKLRHICNLLTPGLVFAADGALFARAIAAVVEPDAEVVLARNPLTGRRTTPFTELAELATAAVDAAHAKVGPGHHRQVSVHLGLDRHAEGRHQHAAHAVLEPGDDQHGAGVFHRRAAGARRLGAVEPHRRRQPRLSASSSTTAARSTSMKASRRRPRFEMTLRNLREVAPTCVLHRAERLRGPAAIFSTTDAALRRTSSAA